MPRATTLSDIEQARVLAYKESGVAICEIAAKLNRHRNTISNFVKSPDSYATIKRTGAKPKVDERAKREIRRLATRKNMSAAQIKRELSLDITKRRVQQILHEDVNLKYQSRLAKPKLLPRHKTARINFAEKYKFFNEEWYHIIFSDEKKFNMDGPDGCQKYWRDLREPRQNRYSRNFQGGSLMTWAGFGYKGKTPICFISHKMDAKLYVDLLDNVLINFSDDIYGETWTFQQDNAAIHTAKYTKEFFESRKIPLLQWPAISPDLNPMENLWSILSQQVYRNGRQFNNLKDLKKAIQEEWDKIDISVLQSLINSMPRRLNDVIINNGGHTNY